MMNGSLQMGASSLHRPISSNLDYEQYEEDNDQNDPTSPPHSPTSTSSSSSSEDDETLSSPTSPPRSPSPPRVYIHDEDYDELNIPQSTTLSECDPDYHSYLISTSNISITPYYEIPSKPTHSQIPSYDAFDADPTCPENRHEKTPWCDPYLCDNSPGAPMWISPYDSDDDNYNSTEDEEEEEDTDKENWMEEEMLWRMVRKPRALKSFAVRWAMRQEWRWGKEQQGRKERRIQAVKRWRKRVLDGKKKWEMSKVGRRSLLGL